MAQAIGILTAALQQGVQAILVKPKRAIGPFTAQVTLSEVHTDELEITDHPVDQGASISDHAFKRPAEVVIECVWSNSPQNPGLLSGLLGAVTQTVAGVQAILSGAAPNQMIDVYQKLLQLQEDRIPFDVLTGKRKYSDMLLKTLTVHTDRTTENILSVTAHLRQVLIVQTVVLQTVPAPAADQKLPEQTTPSLDKGAKSVIDGLPSINVQAAADALVSSSVHDIYLEAIGFKEQLDGAASFFTPNN
jgi:hypothetical protein